MIGSEEGGGDGGNPSAVLQEPVPLEDPGGGLGRGEGVPLLPGEEGDLGEVGEGEGVDRRLLRVEEAGDRLVELRAAHDARQRHRRGPELLRVVLHGETKI